jgi:hypothetical protein
VQLPVDDRSVVLTLELVRKRPLMRVRLYRVAGAAFGPGELAAPTGLVTGKRRSHWLFSARVESDAQKRTGSIDVTVHGQPALKWSGPIDQLGEANQPPTPDQATAPAIAISASDGETTWTALTLKMLGGRAVAAVD